MCGGCACCSVCSIHGVGSEPFTDSNTRWCQENLAGKAVRESGIEKSTFQTNVLYKFIPAEKASLRKHWNCIDELTSIVWAPQRHLAFCLWRLIKLNIFIYCILVLLASWKHHGQSETKGQYDFREFLLCSTLAIAGSWCAGILGNKLPHILLWKMHHFLYKCEKKREIKLSQSVILC